MFKKQLTSLKAIAISVLLLFVPFISCFGQNSDTQRICIDSLDFCIVGFVNESHELYVSRHLSPSSISYDQYASRLKEKDIAFVLYDGSPVAYMALANSMESNKVRKFRMTDFLQMISFSRYHSLNQNGVLHFKDKICISNNGDEVVEIQYNFNNGNWRSQDIRFFNWEKYSEEVIPNNEVLIHLAESATVQYYVNVMRRHSMSSLLLASTTFTLSEPISGKQCFSKDVTIPLHSELKLEDLYCISKPGSNELLLSLCMQTDKKGERSVFPIIKLNKPIAGCKLELSIDANGIVDLLIKNSSNATVYQAKLHNLPYSIDPDIK